MWNVLALSAVLAGVIVVVVIVRVVWIRADRQRPDPFAVMQKPVQKYHGYDYHKAVSAKWSSLPPGSEARRAIEASQSRQRDQRIVRLIKKNREG